MDKNNVIFSLEDYIRGLSNVNVKPSQYVLNKNKYTQEWGWMSGVPTSSPTIYIPTDSGTGMVGGDSMGAPIPMGARLDGAYLNTKHYESNPKVQKQAQVMLTAMYKFFSKNKWLSKEGIEEMKTGVDSESILNERSLTPEGNVFMKKYIYFILNRCNEKTITAALEHCKQNEDILMGNYKGIDYAGGANASDVRTIYSMIRKEAATFFKKNPASVKQFTEFSFTWKKDKVALQPLLNLMTSGNDIVIRRLRKVSDTDFDIGFESAYILSALSNPHSVEFEYTAGRIVRCSISG